MNAVLDAFFHPNSEYTLFPFWFLNGKLSEAETERQLKDFVNKGIEGVVLHARLGLSLEQPYMSEIFMKQIVFAVKTAKRLGMKVILYDEGMYPSGSAHGEVVKENPNFAAKCIRPMRCGEEGVPLYRIAVQMNGEDSYIRQSARMLNADEAPQPQETLVRLVKDFSHGTVRGVHEGEDDGQPNAPAAGDLMNAEAMRAFIRLTHDKYYQALSEEFGDTIIGFFTDEPSTTGRNVAKDARSWTDGFEDDLMTEGFHMEDLPALWLNCGGEEKRIRADFQRAVSHRLMRTYYGPLSKWCVEHKIALCGHPDSAQQSSLLKEFQIPGQDVVWRWVAPEDDLALSGEESAQAKCASDMARHIGAKRNLNECFGCCGPSGEMWALTVNDMKWYLDWLFVRGCNLIIPHAFFYEVNPLSLADRPPDVGPNNIWWPYYRQISDYIKRMCAFNTEGMEKARVAVLGTGDALPVDAVRPLYEKQAEFNYLTDEMLLEKGNIREGKIYIEQQVYEQVLLDETMHYRAEALEMLQNGGVPTTYSEKDICPSVKLSKKSRSIRVESVEWAGTKATLFVNEGDAEYTGGVCVGEEATLVYMDPWTGCAWKENAKNGVAPLHLYGRASVIVAACEDTDGICGRRALKQISSRSLDDKWMLRLPDGTETKGIGDWKDDPKLSAFSGTLTASCRLKLNKIPEAVEIDLGDVREIAVLRVNGKTLPSALLMQPYRADITEYLSVGENLIEADITNSLVTYYEHKPWTGGLLGGSRLRIYKEESV